MDKLRVRVYAVRFGDAILISVPERAANGDTEIRHILIDVGNAYLSGIEGGEGHKDVVFDPVIKDIVAELQGRPLDLYVMTHEHYDHVQGLAYGDKKVIPDLKAKLQTRYSWLTGSAKTGYYDTHLKAKEKRLALEKAYLGIANYLWASPEPANPYVAAMMQINNRALGVKKDIRSTAYCVEYLKKLAMRKQNTCYVHRPRADHPQDALKAKHDFRETRLSLWAPEEDTAVYLNKVQPMPLGTAPGPTPRSKPRLIQLEPPGGVDAGAFYNLAQARRRTYFDNLLAIDSAENDTSIVLLLEWRGWKLLFTGDAEHKSWQIMDELDEMLRAQGKGLLESVDFLKVSHHGSDTGMPSTGILDKILPGKSHVSPSGKQRHAAISTYPMTYSGVPDSELLSRQLAPRCTLHYTDKLEDGGYIDFEFEDGADEMNVVVNGPT
jgi:hypothetical protein